MIPRVLQHLLRVSTHVLMPIEQLIMHRCDDMGIRNYPPVFIIGAPRSGTTLLYQLLINRYRFAYFNNITALLYLSPTVAFWLTQRLVPGKAGMADYQSKHGATAKWYGPHEAGNFWYRWFPKGMYVHVPPGAIHRTVLDELRQEMAAVAAVTRESLLLKNTYNTMRIAPLIEAFPEASFIVLRRDPFYTAQSILASRVETNKNKEVWWSVPPKEIDEINQHPYWEQVVEQVYYIYKQIDADRRCFGGEYFYDVHYEKLCQDTHQTLDGIEAFLQNRGVCVDVCGDVPSSFPISKKRRIEDEDYRLIGEAVKRLWK